MKYFKIICLAAIITLLCSCLSSKLDTDFSDAALVGKITDMDNQPCSNVTVIIDNGQKTVSDINGNFYLTQVKRGVHQFKFSKPGYREEVCEYEFMNISQVIYQKMISMEQVLREIETDITGKKYSRAQDYIEIGKSIDAANPILNYLQGVLFFKLGRFDRAIEKLESILNEGYEDAYIYLTLTDIYEYQKSDYANAYKYIQKYLELRDDRTAQLRAIIIKNSIPKPEETTETAPADESTPMQ